MITKGIRGAITVENNTKEALENATLELLCEMFEKNGLEGTSKISHVIFTTTKDLDAAFPAMFPRLAFGWEDVAMMCFHELDVPNSLFTKYIFIKILRKAIPPRRWSFSTIKIIIT